MGRSVSYPRFAEVAFTTFEAEDDSFAADDFAMELDTWKDMATDAWPSFYACDKWLDREDHAVLQNSWAYFGVSEYCGLVAIWIVAKELEDFSRQVLADRWVAQAGDKLRARFGQFKKIATMSNGEAVFERA